MKELCRRESIYKAKLRNFRNWFLKTFLVLCYTELSLEGEPSPQSQVFWHIFTFFSWGLTFLFIHPSTLTRFPAKMMLPPPCFLERLPFICCPWLMFTALIGKALIRRQPSPTTRMKHKHLQTVQGSHWCKVNLIADLLTCTHTCKTHTEKHTHTPTASSLYWLWR